MSQFEVKTKNLKKNADAEKVIAKKINSLSSEIHDVAKKIRLDDGTEKIIKKHLATLYENNKDSAAKIKSLAEILTTIAAYYDQAEQNISGNDSSNENDVKDKIKEKLKDIADGIRKLGKWLGLDGTSCFSDDPVNLANGNYVYEKNFFHFDTILPINVRFFYNVKNKKSGVLGVGWLHNFECCLYRTEDTLHMMNEDGAEEIFVWQDGSWLACSGTFGTLKQKQGEYIHTDEEGYIRHFDSDGKLLSIETRDGWKIQAYYKEGQLSCIDCTDGISLTFSYNDENKLIQISDHTGRSIYLEYFSGQLCGVTDPEGYKTRYEYTEGNLSTIITPLNHIGLYNEFDSQGRTVSQIFPDGGEVKYLYNDEEGSVIMIRQNGEKTEYIHDELYRNTKVIYEDEEEVTVFNENNRKTSFTDKLGNETLYDYDEAGRLTGMTNALGNKMQLLYNEHGQVQEVQLDGVRMSSCKFDEKGRQSGNIDARGFQTAFEYDKLGRVTKTIHEDGSETRLVYDNAGNIVLVEDPVAGVTEYSYDEQHRVISSVDALGNETKYAYDQNDNLTEVIDALGNHRTYEYDAQGNLIQLEDFNHGITTIEYNVMNKPTHVKDADGNSTYYTYDLMSNVTKVAAADGSQTFYEYDRQNRKTKIIYPSGGEEKAEYDACGNLKKRIAQDGGEYLFSYDALGRPIEITDPLGRTRKAVFDNLGNVTDIYYEDGSEEHFQFDAMGNQTFWQDKNGYKRYYTHDALGHVLQIKDDTGILVEYTYLSGGRLFSEKCINGSAVEYQYDAVGNIICAKSSTEGIWKFSYDKLGRVIQIEREGIGVETYEYDEVGNVTAIVDGEGNRTTFDYSFGGSLLRVTDPTGVQTGYRYDGCNRLIDIIQAESGQIDIQKLNQYNRKQKEFRITSYTRDSSGNVIAVTDPEEHRSEYEYDLCGRILAHKDEEGNVTRCSYRKDGTEELLQFQDGKTIRYQYDALKRLIQIEDWLGKTSFQRDAEGNILRTTDHLGQKTEYQWSNRGECTEITYPDGKKAAYEYDECMHLTKLQYENQSVQYKYYQNGLRKEKLLQNGLRSSYVYDNNGNIAALSHFNNEQLLDRYQYFYDACGRKNRIVEEHDHMSESTDRRFYYNALGSISAVEENGEETERYLYDIFGNRTEVMNRGAVTAYEYDRLNHMRSSKTGDEIKKYSYDCRGNLTGMAVNGIQKLTLHFDALNRLAHANSENGESVYEYNGLDVLTQIKKKTGMQKTHEYYAYDYTKAYDNLLTFNGNGQNRNYVWDQELLFEAEKEEVSVFLNDERMNPVTVFANECVQAHYSYDIWGNQKALQQNANSNLAGFGFTGYRRDEITGYYHAGKRKYDSANGRFIAQDPVAGSAYRPISCNPFLYCISDPINHCDPTGEVVAWLAGGIIGCVANVATKVAGDVVTSVKNGKVTVSPWQEYVGTAAGGFVQGSVLVASGNGAVAGAAGSATETFLSNGLKMVSGTEGYRKEDGYTAGKLLADTVKSGATGAVTGFAFQRATKYIKIQGITAGRGNWDATVRSKLTAAANGYVKNIGIKTILKGCAVQGPIRILDQIAVKTIKAVEDYTKDKAKEIIKNLFGDEAALVLPNCLTAVFNSGRTAQCLAAGI